MERTAPSLTGRGFARPRNLTPRSSEALVRRPAAERDGLPLLIEAQAPGLSLADWIREQGQSLHDDLNLAGGLLLRGFEVDSAERFRAAAAAFAPQLLDYKERSSPRSQVSGEVYTSTEHPLDQPIFLHNEQSYSGMSTSSASTTLSGAAISSRPRKSGSRWIRRISASTSRRRCTRTSRSRPAT